MTTKEFVGELGCVRSRDALTDITPRMVMGLDCGQRVEIVQNADMEKQTGEPSSIPLHHRVRHTDRGNHNHALDQTEGRSELRAEFANYFLEVWLFRVDCTILCKCCGRPASTYRNLSLQSWSRTQITVYM